MNMRRRERDSGAGERSVCTLPTLHSELAVDHVRPLIVAAVEPLDSCGREGGGGCLHAPVAQPEPLRLPPAGGRSGSLWRRLVLAVLRAVLLQFSVAS